MHIGASLCFTAGFGVSCAAVSWLARTTPDGLVMSVFGAGGAAKMCKDYKAEFLGALPLDIRIREQADSGKPSVAADPDSPIAETYRKIARRVAVKISEQAKDMTSKFPTIVVQNT